MNVGIIGCGAIGNKRALNLGNNTLKAVADIELEKAMDLAVDNIGVKIFKDYKDLLKENIDIVIVSTTNNFLYPVALDAVRSGKHVLIEKPAATNKSDLNTLMHFAEVNNVKVMVGYNLRHHPAISEAKKLVDAGEIGKLMFVRGRYGHGGRKGYDKEWRADPKISGGGELIDQGVHLIDLSMWFLGDFYKVYGSIYTYFWNMPAEDNAFLHLESVNGQAAWLHVSCTEWKNIFSFEIYGKTGKIIIDGLGGSYGAERITLYKMYYDMGIPDGWVKEFNKPDVSMKSEFEYFVDCIKNNKDPSPGLKEASRVLEIVEDIYSCDKYESQRT